MDVLEFDATFESEGDTLAGVVHVFGTRTLRDGKYHRFDEHAFDASLPNAMAFYGHDKNKPLAKPSLAIDGGKLTYRMTLGHQSYAEDLRENVKSGLMDKMSFGVYPEKWNDVREKDGTTTRNYTQAHLYDISPVAIPAFEGTVAGLFSDDPDARRREAARARWRVMEGKR